MLELPGSKLQNAVCLELAELERLADILHVYQMRK